jgi:ribosomal protein S18 acetylase RimI-like enzyme
MRKALPGAFKAPNWPDGVNEAPFDRQRDLAEVHALLTSAYPPEENPFSDVETWSAWLTGDAEYSSEAIFLARDSAGRLVGVCHCWTSAFIKDLAVARGHRRRGIGEALLLRSFAHFAGKGASYVDLKVKVGNPSGAERLYERLGMVEVALDPSA